MIYDLTWWAVLAAILPCWLLTNITHELAHGIGVKVKGWDFKLWPLPVFCDTQGNDNYYIWQQWGWIKKANRPDHYVLYFAMCEFIPVQGHEILSQRDWAWIYIAPRLSNFAIFTVCITAGAFQIGSIPESILAVWAACNFVDYVVGQWRIFWKPADYTDIWRFQTCSGWSVAVIRAMTVCFFAVSLTLFLIPL